ncbi:MAG: rRNA methyltransferase [Treponema sp.]|jgi:hypothetical protein|nr:rRNA methyltransferase [Treponema sp.]
MPRKNANNFTPRCGGRQPSGADCPDARGGDAAGLGGFLFPPPGAEACGLMEKLFELAGSVFPVPARFRGRLNRDVAELSRLLTSARGERGVSYLGKSAMLTAYLRCFLPWNVYRLVRLLPSLPLALSDGDTVADLGSGPLTLPIALWIARPELRPLKLVFRCVDRTGAAMDAGKKLFAALAASPGGGEKIRGGGKGGAGSGVFSETAWTIKTIKGDILRRGRRGEREGLPPPDAKPALVCAVNVYNESFGDIPHTDSRALARFAGQEAHRLSEMAADGASILVAEPGVPRSGEFIAFLRDALAALGRPAVSPCTHNGPCPFPGGRGGRAEEKRKWCHFAFDTEDAPKKLRDLSAASGIPKERAVLSFLLAGGAARGTAAAGKPGALAGAGKAGAPGESKTAVRVLSDKFPITGITGIAGKSVPAPRPAAARSGRYGCSQLGAVLLAGTEAGMDAAPSGALLYSEPPAHERRDSKSGALVLDWPPPAR